MSPAGLEAQAMGAHPLAAGVTRIRLVEGSAVRFTVGAGQTIAEVGGSPAAVIVEHGPGEVVLLADLGVLGNAKIHPQTFGSGTISPTMPDNGGRATARRTFTGGLTRTHL